MLLLASCVKKADIDLPEQDKKLVVTSFISPDDSVIYAVVRSSVPRFGSNNTASVLTAGYVPDATVTISNDLTSKVLTYDKEQQFYRISSTKFPIEPGKKYFLNVKSPDGRSVSAVTKVPDSPMVIESLKSEITRNDISKIEVNIEMRVKDIPGQTNYLAIFFHQNSDPANDDPFSVFGYFDTDEKILKDSYYHFSGASFFSTDTLKSARLDVQILNCSREFFLYNKSVQEAGIAGMNPFADPVMVYTNINNGFGCFGAYAGNYKTIIIR